MYRAERFTLWYNKLVSHNGKWKLAGSLIKLVDDVNLETPLGMYGGGSSTSNFDIGPLGIAVVARDLSGHNPQETMVSTQLYVPVESFTSPPSKPPQQIHVPASQGKGYASNIRLSPDGSVISYLFTKLADLYNNHIHFAPTNVLTVTKILGGETQNKATGREPPAAFEFTSSSSTLIIQSERQGRTELDYVNVCDETRSRTFYRGGIVSAFHPLREGKWDELVVSSSTLIASSAWEVIGVPEPRVQSMGMSMRNNGKKFGLHGGMVRDFWFAGAHGTSVHAFMVVPSDFDEARRYPVVVRPHGGPVSSWTDSWMVAVRDCFFCLGFWSCEFLMSVFADEGFGRPILRLGLNRAMW